MKQKYIKPHTDFDEIPVEPLMLYASGGPTDPGFGSRSDKREQFQEDDWDDAEW